MVEVKITKEIHNLAIECRNRKRIAVSDKGKNFTGLETKDRHYVGYIAEFAFYKLLKDNDKKATYYISIHGESEEEDFKIFTDRGERTIDVKGTRTDKLLVNELYYKRGDKFRHDLYVGVKYEDALSKKEIEASFDDYGNCTVFGFNRGINDMILDKNMPSPAYTKLLTELDDIDYLMSHIHSGTIRIIGDKDLAEKLKQII